MLTHHIIQMKESKKQRRDNAKVQFECDNESDTKQIREKRKKNVKLKKNLPPLPPVPVAMSSKATNIINNPSCSNISDVTQINVLNNSCSVVSTAMHSKNDDVSNNSSSFVNINKTLLSNSRSQKLDISVPSSNNDKEINHEILKIVQSLKISMNGLTSLIREIIERLDVLEKNSESLQVQSVLDEYNTLVEVFPIKTTYSLKEVETKIENNSAFKGKLIKSLT